MSITRFNTREILVVSTYKDIKDRNRVIVLPTDDYGWQASLYFADDEILKPGELIQAYATEGELFVKMDKSETPAFKRAKNTISVFGFLDERFGGILREEAKSIGRGDIEKLRTSYTAILTTLININQERVVSDERENILVGCVMRAAKADIAQKNTDVRILKTYDGREERRPPSVSVIQENVIDLKRDVKAFEVLLDMQKNEFKTSDEKKACQSTLEQFG